MQSLSEGSLNESVRHKLNSKGKHNTQSSLPRESIDSVTIDVLSVLVVEFDSISLLPKPLVTWSLGTHDCLKFNRQLTFTLGFTVKWQRTWLSFITLACVSSETHNLQRVFRLPGGGGGLFPYMGYIGMCGAKGYGFWAALVWNRACELGMFFRRSSSFGDKTITLLMFTPTLYVP